MVCCCFDLVRLRKDNLLRGKCYLSYDVGLVKCVRSALQHDGMDGGTVAGRPAGETGGTGCLESGGSSPGREGDPVGTFHNQPNTLKECQTPAQQRNGRADVLLTSRVSSLLVYLPFISEQDRRNLLSKRAEPLASL